MTARAFPWGSLEAVARSDVRAARAMREWGSRFGRESKVALAAGAILHGRVEILVKSVRGGRDRGRAARGETDVGVLLGLERNDLTGGLLVEAEGALAAAMVGRTVRRAAPRVIDPGNAVPIGVAGAFAAIVVTIARRAHGAFAPQVISAGPARALARDLESHAGETLEATLTILLDDDAYVARVTLPRAVAMGAEEAPWGRSSLVGLGEAPLALEVVAAVNGSTAAEIGTLRRGDAWLPDGWRLTRSATGSLVGPVLLAAPSHDIGIHADLGEDGRLVLRGGLENLAWAEGAGAMSDSVNESERDALIEAVGEVPVVVRVEIGTAEMRAREWASLGRGDVVALGRKIGDAVTLRVGGVAVARGELVDLEGEIGVRILGRAEDR